MYGETEKVEVASPANVMDVLHEEFGNDMFDPCPLVRDDWDGLKRPWGKLNYCNPPFKEAEAWVAKAVYETQTRGCTSVLLFPARTGSRYWEDGIFNRASEIRFVTGSIRFPQYDRNSPFAICIVIYRDGPNVHGKVGDPPPKVPRDIIDREDLINSSAVKSRLPLLWFVASHCETLTRPKQKEFIHWRGKWASRRISPDELFRKWLSKPKSTMNRVYFSLFLQLCEVESREFGSDYGASIPTDTPAEHLSFFRMLCSLRTVMAPYARGFRKMARRPDTSLESIAEVTDAAKRHPWLVKACHFYLVYREFREMEWSRARRSRYKYPCFDGKFTQNIQFVY
jgi:hypothetical protein